MGFIDNGKHITNRCVVQSVTVYFVQDFIGSAECTLAELVHAGQRPLT